MRIAIPVDQDSVSASLGACSAFHFYEDDHGRIVRQFLVPMDGSGTDAALALLERYGIDALVCGGIAQPEREAVAAAGIMLFSAASASPDDAALRFLGGAIAFDESNTCNACGHGHACSMDCESCRIR
ncbi:MAG: NifB/NifX family molybdenum-iron cluster-binding protein [Hominicoprocola sp.]|nr:NifB/NifX family molybdenum-iron cluster-binding protein [Oscillospiraceae bacterium]